MHDVRAIRENPELYEKHWAAKGLSGRVAAIYGAGLPSFNDVFGVGSVSLRN